MNDNINAGADINAGDGGYSESTKEKYDEFAKGRNQMNELETLLKNHVWNLSGYVTRPALDLAMKNNGTDSVALWEKYCPWSNTNGGYINWSKNAKR